MDLLPRPAVRGAAVHIHDAKMIPSFLSRVLANDRAPFEPGGRHLRITVYCPQTHLLSADDQFRFSVLQELAHLDTLRVVGTDQSFPWRIVIDPTPNEHGAAVVDLIDPENQWAGGHAFYPRDWTNEAGQLLRIDNPQDDPRTCTLALRLPMLAAHIQTYRDLFITSYQDFLKLRPRVPDANVADLREGLQIIGLYLRSSGDFTIRAFPKSRHSFDRDLFYWVLCRHRLPAMWRYFSACLQHDRDAPRDTSPLGNLAGTILTRCLRALQARDEVGFRFYRRQHNSTRSEMLYHFDYLTILLAGAFDAAARVAHYVYDMATTNARTVNFRHRQFRQALRATGRAQRLAQVIDDSSFQAFHKLLAVLRNSIHGAGLHGIGVSRVGEPEASLLSVIEDHEHVWDTAVALGSPGDLGVTKQPGIGVAIEPYTCAVRLCEHGLAHVNDIAAATDVERLLADESRATLLTEPPDDRVFGHDIRRRIGTLG